jgi:hypothetical protein
MLVTILLHTVFVPDDDPYGSKYEALYVKPNISFIIKTVVQTALLVGIHFTEHKLLSVKSEE